jgi:diacylglycerol kinase family enzyme
MTAIPDGTTVVIVNPNSGRGRVRSLLGDLERLLPTLVDRHHIELTRGPGDGLRLAREAAVAGAPNVVAVGGDGTLHEVVNGLVTSNVKVPSVVLMPAGRGSDFARGLRIPLAVDRALHAYADQKAWQRIMRAGMSRDFSWEKSAREYAALYRGLVG